MPQQAMAVRVRVGWQLHRRMWTWSEEEAMMMMEEKEKMMAR
jgi:hypothetical protein